MERFALWAGLRVIKPSSRTPKDPWTISRQWMMPPPTVMRTAMRTGVPRSVFAQIDRRVCMTARYNYGPRFWCR